MVKKEQLKEEIEKDEKLLKKKLKREKKEIKSSEKLRKKEEKLNKSKLEVMDIYNKYGLKNIEEQKQNIKYVGEGEE